MEDGFSDVHRMISLSDIEEKISRLLNTLLNCKMLNVIQLAINYRIAHDHKSDSGDMGTVLKNNCDDLLNDLDDLLEFTLKKYEFSLKKCSQKCLEREKLFLKCILFLLVNTDNFQISNGQTLYLGPYIDYLIKCLINCYRMVYYTKKAEEIQNEIEHLSANINAINNSDEPQSVLSNSNKINSVADAKDSKRNEE